MVQPYPLPRGVRESAVLVADGTNAAYGPFQFKIFDTADVKVWTLDEGAGIWAETAATVTKTDPAAPFSTFSISFETLPAEGAQYVVSGQRTHERSLAVSKGTILSAEQLERELSKQGTVLQELRRDLNASVRIPFGYPGQMLPVPEANTIVMWNTDGTRLVNRAVVQKDELIVGVNVGDLFSGKNLSDLSDKAAARTNLGLGTAALEDASTFATAVDMSAFQAAFDDLDTSLGTAALESASTFAPAADVIALHAAFNSLEANQGGGGLVFSSLAALQVELDYGAHQKAEVRGDGANDAIYKKVDAPGTGSWTYHAPLPEATVEQSVSATFYAAELASITERRGWTIYPSLGEQAAPEGPARRLAFNRASSAVRLNARGLLSSVETDVVAHAYDADGGYLGWLIEPDRTNLALYSEAIDNAYWLKTRGTISGVNVIAAPDGTLTAEKYEEDGQDGAHTINTGSTIAVAAGDYVTASIFVRPDERDECQISSDGAVWTGAPSAQFSLVGAGALVEPLDPDIINAGIELLPTGWYRIWMTGQVATAGNARVLYSSILNGAGGYVGVPGEGLYFWGAQVEKGVNPTSYIKTTDAAATREDVLSATDMAVNAEKGTVVVCFTCPYDQTDAGGSIAGVYADADNRAHVSITSGNFLSMAFVAGGEPLAIVGPELVPGKEYLPAISWNAGAQYLAVDGVLYSGTPVSAALTGIVDFVVGSLSGSGGAGAFNGMVRGAYFFPGSVAPDVLRNMSTPNFSGGGSAPEEFLSETERRAFAGAVTETSFTAFSDLGSTSDVQLVVSRSRDMWNPVFVHALEAPVATAGETENYLSTKQTAIGLQPDTEYWWAFRQDGAMGHPRRLRTAPAVGAAASFDFSVISCSNVIRSTVHDIFNAMASEGFAFVHHLGDIAYPDIVEPIIGRHRDQLVRRFLSGPSASKMFESTALGIYELDNHDGNNGHWSTVYTGTTFQELNTLTRQAYRETVPHHPFEQDRLGINNASPDTVTLTQRMTWGRVRFIAPDLISQWDNGANDTHLGATFGYEYWDQRQWLYDQIAEAEADPAVAMIVLLCSDTWHGVQLSWQITHPAEWTALRDYINVNVAKKFVLVCGDGHAGGIDDGASFGGNFPVVMSSGVYQSTSGSGHDVGPFFFDGVDTGIFETGEIYLYTALRVVDNGGTDISLTVEFETAPVDAETKAPMARGSYVV